MDERFRDRMRRERTDVILREAAGLASESGWTALRLEDVARRAGIAKGTIYLDFKDKDELIAAASRRSMTEVLSLMQVAAAKTDDAGQLGAALRILASLPLDHPDLTAVFRITHGENSPSRGSLDEIEHFLTRLFREAQAQGSLNPDVDAEFAAQSTLASAAVPAWSRMAMKKGPDALLSQLRFGPAHSA